MKKYKNNPFHPDNWPYDESLDSYMCPEQRTVVFRNQGLRRDRYGFTRTIRFYQCETCLDCSVRVQCTKAKSTHARVIQKNRKWLSYKGQMKQLLSEEKTGAIYRRRKIDVKPAFGFLKTILGFTRLSVRGKEQVKNELGLPY
ncbi:transposase [Enterococcus sp. BWT-B8]|nr:transposase [Enterococcus sp. BWT-B8]